MSTPPEGLSTEQQRTLALVALAQAAYLVDKAAYGQSTHEEASSVLFYSLYDTSPATFDDIIPHIDTLTLGLTYLRKVLKKPTSDSDKRILAYILNVIHLERKLQTRPDLIDRLTQTLDKMCAYYESAEDRLQPNAIAELGELYRTTLGTLSPRIEVKGDPEYIRRSETSSIVRALLLAGIRFAMLWEQLGGRRWQLVFRRKQLLTILDQLYNRLMPGNLLQ
ncbi:MAG: DUF489 family protein [Gammaproteobacteria bacterium]